MEISRRRVLQKHLEPARPLRRSLESTSNTASCAQELMETGGREETIGIEQFCKIVNLHKQKEAGRISYSREFLIGLATCPESRKRPEYLPDHSIVLTKPREMSPEMSCNDGKEDE